MAGHPEVDEQRLPRIELQQQVLAAPPHRRYASLVQAEGHLLHGIGLADACLPDALSAGRHAIASRRGCAAGYSRLLDTAAEHLPLEVPPHGLDFWKLRQLHTISAMRLRDPPQRHGDTEVA